MIRLRLLGALALDRDDGTTVRSVLDRPKRFAVLAFLAASSPTSGRPRDSLLGLFWPEMDEAHARKALRQTLYGLRQSLGPGVVAGKGAEIVGVDPERLRCDAAAFSAAVEEGRDEEALELYRGPFLEGFHLSGAPEFERWAQGKRRRLRTQATAAAWRLAEADGRAGDRAAARARAERALELAPYDGEGIRRYLALMRESGQPAAAVRAYEAYEARLARELDLEPSAETRALVERIRSGDGGRGAAPPPDGPRPSDTAPDPPDAAVARGPAGPGEAVPPADGGSDGAAGAPGPGPPSRVGRRRLAAIGVTVGLVALAVGVLAALGVHAGLADDAPRIRSLAVLPLENLSGDPEQAYFTDGMTEALIAELGEIGSLKVISRTSAMRYEGTDKRMPEIARELDVDALVEGSVLRDADDVRITLQLVHGRTDRHLWSGKWERGLGDIFALQEEVARGIAAAVRAEISPDEARRIAEPLTRDAEAYTHYLRGNDYLHRESRKDWETAERMYATAAELDPGFAKAWERLVYVRGLLSVGAFDTVRLAAAREARDRLRELEPDSDLSHAARGWYAFWGELDLARARREFEIVRRRRPGDAEILWAAASVDWRAARWEEAVAPLQRLLELDPRNPEVPARLARVHAALRRFEEAERYIDMALSLAPDIHFHYVTKWRVVALGQGDTARAAGLVEEAGPYVRREEHAWLRAIVAEFRRDFPTAIEGFRSWPAPSRTKYLYVARLADRVGDAELAGAYADSLRRMAEARLTKAIRHQNVPQMAVARYDLGRVHAIPGDAGEAVRQAEEALRLMPLGSAGPAPGLVQGLVWIYARAGREDEAVRLLERLLEIPGGETVHALRLNPVYDALRDHPGFRALTR